MSNSIDNTPLQSLATQSENDQRETKKTAIQQRPGRLTGDVLLTLHTTLAQKLFLGFRSRHRSINLLQFGGRMSVIWQAAEQDDPYADWYLLKVYDALLTLRQQLAKAIATYEEQLNAKNQLSHLQVSPFVSKTPVVESLWFKTQYGYMGASLVADFDHLMRLLLTANRIGVVFDQPHKTIQQDWIDKLLALFRLPFHWKSLGITRADVHHDNELAKTAKQQMGKLPELVLSQQLRSPFSPTIKQPTNNTTNEPIKKQKTEKNQQKKNPVNDDKPTD